MPPAGMPIRAVGILFLILSGKGDLMEVQGRQAGEPTRSRAVFEAEQRALIEASRSRVRDARDHLEALARERLTNLRAAREQALAEERAVREARVRGRADAAERRDRIELSAEARALSEADASGDERRVAELAEEHRSGALNTPERIERAAQRLLEG